MSRFTPTKDESRAICDWIKEHGIDPGRIIDGTLKWNTTLGEWSAEEIVVTIDRRVVLGPSGYAPMTREISFRTRAPFPFPGWFPAEASMVDQ